MLKTKTLINIDGTKIEELLKKEYPGMAYFEVMGIENQYSKLKTILLLNKREFKDIKKILQKKHISGYRNNRDVLVEMDIQEYINLIMENIYNDDWLDVIIFEDDFMITIDKMIKHSCNYGSAEQYIVSSYKFIQIIKDKYE